MRKENMYSLFIGFRKLGEFQSILEAKRYAHDSKLSGTFSLIGNNYHDSWYIPKSQITNMKITDITGKSIEVTNLNKAIKQCKLCQDSLFLMASGHTVGEDHRFMLRQLEKLKLKPKTLRRREISADFFSR